MYQVTIIRPNSNDVAGFYATEEKANEVAQNIRDKAKHSYEVVVSEREAMYSFEVTKKLDPTWLR
jgi:hypothetical protein